MGGRLSKVLVPWWCLELGYVGGKRLRDLKRATAAVAAIVAVVPNVKCEVSVLAHQEKVKVR